MKKNLKQIKVANFYENKPFLKNKRETTKDK